VGNYAIHLQTATFRIENYDYRFQFLQLIDDIRLNRQQFLRHGVNERSEAKDPDAKMFLTFWGISLNSFTILYYSNFYSTESPCESEALRAGNS